MFGHTKAGKEKRKHGAATMSVVEHLSELRDRIFASLVVVAVGALVCFLLFEPIIGFITRSYVEAAGKNLIFTRPLEGFTFA